MGAIALASNPIYHVRNKYVEVDYHFIREKVLHKDITISHLSTYDQCRHLHQRSHRCLIPFLAHQANDRFPSPGCGGLLRQ